MSTATRSASSVVAKAAKGLHVFRIDGHSLTNQLPSGETITSLPFYVGGRS
jgi:speckle-type POZ protein